MVILHQAQPTYMEYLKMTKPMVRIHDLQTNEIVDREMTNAEYAIHEADQAKWLIKQSEIKAKAEAKTAAQAKLAALGLTVEDLQALGL